MAPTTSIKDIPHALRHLWQAVVADCLQLIVDNPGDPHAWYLFLGLPALCLRPGTPREVIQGALTAWTKARLLACRAGDWQRLMDLQPDLAPRAADDEDEDENAGMRARVRRVVRACRRVNYSKAARVAVGEPPVRGTPQVLEMLRAKHPELCEEIPRDILDFQPRDLPEINMDTLNKVIRTSKKDAGCGPDTWRYEHIKALRGDDRCIELLLKVANIAARGELPAEVAPYLGAARLVALLKKGTVPAPEDVRPIAIGAVFRRIVGRCLLVMWAQRFRDFFAHIQVAVSVPNGAELVTKALQIALSDHPDWVVVEMDIANAFNTVSRARFMRAIKNHFPELLPYMRQFYAQEMPLVTQDITSSTGYSTIPSREGVHQGDPMSGFAHAIAIHAVLLEMSQSTPTGFVISYADDTRIVAPAAEAAAALEVANLRMPGLNQEPQPHKSHLYSPNPVALAEAEALIPGIPTVPADQGLTVCGSPVGADEWVLQQLPEPAATIGPLLDFLPNVGDAQIEFLLLFYCALPKINHLVRCVRPSLMREVRLNPLVVDGDGEAPSLNMDRFAHFMEGALFYGYYEPTTAVHTPMQRTNESRDALKA